MKSIAYFNGKWLPLEKVKISPLDRGFLFSDGVYEVIPVYNNKPFFLENHIERLLNSLKKIRTYEKFFLYLSIIINKRYE